jgi:hypothetical protein
LDARDIAEVAAIEQWPRPPAAETRKAGRNRAAGVVRFRPNAAGARGGSRAGGQWPRRRFSS